MLDIKTATMHFELDRNAEGRGNWATAGERHNNLCGYTNIITDKLPRRAATEIPLQSRLQIAPATCLAQKQHAESIMQQRPHALSDGIHYKEWCRIGILCMPT